MEKRSRDILVIVVLILIILSLLFISFSSDDESDSVKIGVITDLTGPAAYWGESTRVGAEIAADELNGEGIEVELVFEDYRLEASLALNAAQKLVGADGVDAIYVDFNPAAISVGSFLIGKDLLFVYDAAVVSPLEGNPGAYKTYLDYREGCKQVSQKFLSEGVEEMGVLKVNLEFGVCL